MCPARSPVAGAGEARSGDVRLRLGRELKALRTTRSIRLEDAARTLGIAASTLSRIENGRAPARAVFVSSLLTAYGLREDSEGPQIFRTGDPIGFSPERNGIKCRGNRSIILRSSRSRPSGKWLTPRRRGQ